MSLVHFRADGVPACGAHKAMPSTQTTTTADADRVTCRKCPRTLAYRRKAA